MLHMDEEQGQQVDLDELISGEWEFPNSRWIRSPVPQDGDPRDWGFPERRGSIGILLPLEAPELREHWEYPKKIPKEKNPGETCSG